MHYVSARRPRRSLLSVAFCAVLVLAILSIAGAIAAPSRATTQASTERLCADASPGFMACFAERVTTPSGGVQPFAVPSGYGPADIQGAYKLSTSPGAGRTVAIVDAYDLPTAESDLATYRSQFGLPACTTANGCFRKINQNGGTTPPAADAGWGGEIALDIDMVSATCPQCKILLVEANSPSNANLGIAVNQAAAQGAVAVSNSYGGPESSSETSLDTSYYRHAGVAITASSGDSGYGTSYPASSPYVTSVGGTSLTRSSNARGWTESVWSGSGSGCSSFEAKPSFQTDTGCSRRTMADVSAVADPNTGVAVYDSYGAGAGWQVYGGTSASSPIVASVFAMATPPAAGVFPVQYPYANRGALFDVTSGSNGSCSPSYLCTGTAGYDGPTGLGTPNGTAAFGPSGTTTNDFSVSVSPSSGSVVAGSGTTATVSTATVSGSAQSVTLTASGLPAGAGATFSLATVTSGSSSTLTVSTSSSTPAGTYPITITATGSSATHTTTFTLTVTTSGGGTCASGQKLANPGFESGAASWSATSGVIGQSGSSGEATHSGTWDAWLDGYGRSHTDTLSQSVAIPTGCTTYTLSFYLHIDSAETTTSTKYDTLTVKVGATTLATYSNLDKRTGYVQRSFNVAQFAGQTVTLTFTGTEDTSLQTSFVIDDTALTVS
jgi:hypothetical protein